MQNNVIRKTSNRWTKGLIMDFSPENTKNEVLSNALNATLLTFNGNELSLQNDMGNARVETAYLPEGYMPVGTCEYGGIIYIVSYNPLEDKSQIGCFPSPERNISSDELGQSTEPLKYQLFQKIEKNNNDSDIITGGLIQTSYSVLLKQDNLNPGDKFIITSGDDIYEEAIKDMYIDNTIKENPIIALNIVSIEDSGKIVYLNSDVRQYKTTIGDKTYKYNILGSSNTDPSSIKKDIDSYRNTISSGYSVFKSKTSGKLAILAELIMIDSYSVTHSVKAKSGSDTEFDIILHTDVSPKLNAENYLQEPKLKYYYLSNSQGYMQTVQNNQELKVPLFDKNNSTSSFYNINLNDVYSSNNFQLFDKSLKDVSEFRFPISNTYHGRLISYNENNYLESDIYTKFFENDYHKINVSQIKSNSGYFYNTLQATVYKYIPGGSDEEILYTNSELNEQYTYYVKISNSEYVDAERDVAYKTEILYEIVAPSAIATKDIIENKNIEKFQYQQIYYFKKATSEDLTSGKTLYYREDKDGETSYSQLMGEQNKNVQYYVHESENILVSIGYEVTTVTSQNIYYYPGTKTYYAVSDDKKDAYYNFSSYPMDENSPSLGAPFNLYRKVESESFREATTEELQQYTDDPTSIVLYYIENYEKVPKSSIDDGTIKEQDILFIVFPHDEIITKNYFIPSQEFNYIKGTTLTDTYPKNDPIEVLTMADFIPEDGKYDYNDVKLASIKIPNVVIDNGLDLPFKYDYTIVPCMNYGRLDHLAISNTIDFGKLHAFNQSGFHTWKYYVENGQLRLTFGTDIYDTYEELKVDGIILEFYDLWGYAGTLEITDKKSYSGVFTKIISLNTINALSNKKIVDGHYSNQEYVRNIEITNNNSIFKYKDFIIQHNDITGWKASGTSKTIDNDCGVLYSNIIYGVKTYFRRKITDDNYEFIHKKDFFVYTLPIFNEYYVSLQNFDTIKNPELKFTLTYKLEDESNKAVLTANNITNGYNNNDYENIRQYLNGAYPSNILEVTKYYNYTGTSKLYLEIGLNEEYKNLNLFSSGDLNNHYSCKLKLVDDNIEKSFSVKTDNSEITDINYTLNYNGIVQDTNSLNFKNGNDKYELELSNISNYNYISNTTPISIDINYSFNVGYKAKITNITTTQIPATTICALFHKKQDDLYNYEDFGIFDKEVEGLYSETMIYTSGDTSTSILGICKQIGETGSLSEQCQHQYSYSVPSRSINKPFLLHSGENIKNICKHLKRLAFYQPHAHGSITDSFFRPNLSTGAGQNPDLDLTMPTAERGGFKVSSDEGDDAYGNFPLDNYSLRPQYNFVANTLDSIKYYSEFVSAINYVGCISRSTYGRDDDGDGAWDWQLVDQKIFQGFTGEQLVQFNTKLLKSMSSIYAYNPDYNTLNVNTGKVTLQDYFPIFSSNIINTQSNFDEGLILNNYIYFGGMQVSKYLKYLKNHSNIQTYTDDEQPVGQVNFTSNFENCGTDINPVLLSSLTYKASIPEEISDDLTFDTSQRLVLKHTDGTTQMIKGTPNKKALYGYDPKFNKLVTLDVSNYIIEKDGTLRLNYLKVEPEPINDNSIVSIDKSWLDGDYVFNTSIYQLQGILTLSLDNSLSNLKYYEGSDKLYLLTYAYSSGGVQLYNDIIFDIKSYNTSYAISLYDIIRNYRHVVFKWSGEIYISDLVSSPQQVLLDLLDKKNGVVINGITLNENSYINKSILVDKIDNGLRVHSPSSMDFTGICIVEIQISELQLQLNKYITPQQGIFINSNKTSKYSDIIEHKYKVKLQYDSARFRGTSVTINDLVYEPNIDGHRLYMNNNLYIYDDYLENKIAYRSYDWWPPQGCEGYQNTNDLFMATGPCFTLDNL